MQLLQSIALLLSYSYFTELPAGHENSGTIFSYFVEGDRTMSSWNLYIANTEK